MRSICALLVTCVGCAAGGGVEIDPYLDSSKADGHPAHLHLRDDHKLHVDEPSDLVLVDGDLYTVSDQHSKIYAITPGGHAEEYLNVDARDLEAIAFEPASGEFLLGDEQTAKVWHIDGDGGRHDAIEIDAAQDGNSGIEGLTVLPNGDLIVAKEKHPAKIFQLDASGTLVDKKTIEFTADISAITWNPDDEHLYALSDEKQSLYRLDKHWNADRAWALPFKHPEGIAFDGSTLYIVSDSAERIYEFELEQ